MLTISAHQIQTECFSVDLVSLVLYRCRSEFASNLCDVRVQAIIELYEAEDLSLSPLNFF